jgi:hypothetical protein
MIEESIQYREDACTHELTGVGETAAGNTSAPDPAPAPDPVADGGVP